MICGGIWFLSNQLCLFYPRALLRSRFLYCTTWYKYKKTNWQMDKPTTEGHICKTVRNARLTGFQTMYTIKSALDLVGSNMISIDLGCLSQWLSNIALYGTQKIINYTWKLTCTYIAIISSAIIVVRGSKSDSIQTQDTNWKSMQHNNLQHSCPNAEKNIHRVHHFKASVLYLITYDSDKIPQYVN